MKNVRVISRLDIKGPNLVKGIHLEGLRVLGKPQEFAEYYYRQGADELMFFDVVASLYERNSLKDIITKTAEQIFIPLTVGGGLRTILDMKDVLRAGADKVALNTAAIKNPDIVRQAALEFGSSTVVIVIEAIKNSEGQYQAFTDNGRDYTGVEVKGWAQQVADLGAGELVVTSVDREGTGAGYDLELTRMIADCVDIPVIAHGGAGTVAHVSEVVIGGHADAVALASMLHYKYITVRESSIDAHDEGNTEFLRSKKGFAKCDIITIGELKTELNHKGIACRT